MKDKYIIITVGGLIMFMFCVVSEVVNLKKSKSLIGEKIFYLGDTVEVVNYKTFGDNYVLSNGITVDELYVKKNIIK